MLRRIDNENSSLILNGRKAMLITKSDGKYMARLYEDGRIIREKTITELEMLSFRCLVEINKLRSAINEL